MALEDEGLLGPLLATLGSHPSWTITRTLTNRPLGPPGSREEGGDQPKINRAGVQGPPQTMPSPAPSASAPPAASPFPPPLPPAPCPVCRFMQGHLSISPGRALLKVPLHSSLCSPTFLTFPDLPPPSDPHTHLGNSGASCFFCWGPGESPTIGIPGSIPVWPWRAFPTPAAFS